MPVRFPSTPESRSARARYAKRCDLYGADDPRTVESRAAFENYLAAVRAAVSDAPPLTAEQRVKLRQILASAPVAPADRMAVAS